MRNSTNRTMAIVLWVICALIALFMFLTWNHTAEPASSGRRCTLRGHVSRGTIVWSQPPRFSSKSGWRAPIKANLPKGTLVWGCSRKTVGYFSNRLEIVRIAYRFGRGWQFGWMPMSRFTLNQRSALSVVLAAYTVQSDPPPAPDTPKEQSATMGLYGLYSQLFIAVLIGILSRGIWDWTAAPNEFKSHIRSAIGAAVLTPIVFGSFLQTADFNIEGEKGYVMLLLLSFQQGFFWQGMMKDLGQRRNGRDA